MQTVIENYLVLSEILSFLMYFFFPGHSLKPILCPERTPTSEQTHKHRHTQAHLQPLPVCNAWTCKLFVMEVIFIHVSNPTRLFMRWRITHMSKTFAESGPGSNNSILITDNPRAMCTKEFFSWTITKVISLFFFSPSCSLVWKEAPIIQTK